MKDYNVPVKIIMLFLVASATATFAQSREEALFRIEKPKEWYTFLEKSGKNNDPLKVFTVGKDEIHVTGQDFGYLSTTKKYSNFHLTLWFKWGEKKYPPRENEKRDAGVLYLAEFSNGDKVWPRCIEFQIQEGDCGDFWAVDSATIVFKGKVTKAENYHREMKSVDAEEPYGKWNKVEVIVDHGKITHMLNGKVVNEASDPSIKEGCILLQSEGAELYYKDITLTVLK